MRLLCQYKVKLMRVSLICIEYRTYTKTADIATYVYIISVREQNSKNFLTMFFVLVENLLILIYLSDCNENMAL